MFNDVELKATQRQNYRQIRELVRISFGLGVNLRRPTPFRNALRLLNVFLLVCSGLSMYGHWCFIMKHLDNIPKLSESICTSLQTIISMIKLAYYLFMQTEFALLLEQAETYELLRDVEIFKRDFAVAAHLKQETLRILNDTWRDTRHQLIFYICCCTAIISNYFLRAIIVNAYHHHKGTENFVPVLPFPVIYDVWVDKGLSFPYYEIEMFLTGVSDYIAGMGAVSFDGIFIVLCLHCYSMIEVFKLLVSYSTSPVVPPARRVEYLRYCIYFHQRIVLYERRTHNAFKHVSITQFLMSLVILGLVMFQISYGLEFDVNMLIRMIMYMSAAGYEIVLYCYNGQRLTTASEEIPFALYSCQWYDETPEFKTLLRMMIMRTNRIMRFDISWFSTMTLPTLVGFVKTSGSYFLLLRNLSE